MVKKRQGSERTGSGQARRLALSGLVVASCLLASCQGGPPAPGPVPPPLPPAAPVAPPPEPSGPVVPSAAAPPAMPGRGKVLDLSYAVRAPRKGAEAFWRRLERDVRRLAGVGRTEPPIPDFAPLPHEPRRHKDAKRSRRVVHHAKPAPVRAVVAVDRRRGVLTVRTTAERQQAVADYLRQGRSHAR